jgi:ATP-dependent Clp protease ATP-binding subunit ClpB
VENCAGATTLDEYQKYFEKTKHSKDVSKNIIEEPDTESAILRVVSKKNMKHTTVQIKDEAIIAAVELSQRYITNRFLPTKPLI